MNKADMFYHDVRHLLNNKDAYIVLNDSHYPIPQLKNKKKEYTARDIKRYDCTRQFRHITGQPINQILHKIDNNILQNIPILREDFVMAEYMYVPRIPHLKLKTVWRMIQHVDHVKITSVNKKIFIGTSRLPFYVTSCTSMGFFSQHHITAYHVSHRNYDKNPKN